MHMASRFGFDDTPNIVLIGVPNKAALLRAAEQCSEFAIAHYIWSEPDWNFGETAICTEAISGERRKAFVEYRLWTDIEFTRPSPNGKAAASNTAIVGSTPTGRTTGTPVGIPAGLNA